MQKSDIYEKWHWNLQHYEDSGMFKSIGSRENRREYDSLVSITTCPISHHASRALPTCVTSILKDIDFNPCLNLLMLIKGRKMRRLDALEPEDGNK